jgi:glucokinase
VIWVAIVILAGDIGATHSRLCLMAPNGRRLATTEYDSHAFPSLEAVVRVFLEEVKSRSSVRSAAFGVAGPVVRGRSVTTNLPWVVDERTLGRKLSIRRVVLLNDLVALSLGVLAMPASRLRSLGGQGLPKRRGANLAVLAAGTGLGEAALVWDPDRGRYLSCATEGGHTDFAPADETQMDLLRFLRRRFGHVSWERVLSGAGLGNLYDFFVQERGVKESGRAVRALEEADDRNRAICELAAAGASKAAERAVALFVRLYGAEAGNLALKTLAVGGVFVCGNIATAMASVLGDGSFHRAFVDKGRFGPLMGRIPVALVLGTDVGIAGAARVALEGQGA